MAKIPDGTFKNWQETNVIHAADYVQEREMLRAAANDNAERLDELESVATELGLDTVQLQKITNDEGGVKLNITSTITGDVLAELLALGKGLHTFYAIGGSKNLPPTNISTRGIAHITDTGIGWVYATDYRNNIFTNYYDSATWKGWRKLVSNEDTQEQLWSGAQYMNEFPSQVVTPTKKLTECRNGWILVWSDYDPGQGSNNFDFTYSYVPKFAASKYNGGSHLFTVPYSPNSVIVKNVNIFDDRIVGKAENDDAPNNDVVLRYVLEW